MTIGAQELILVLIMLGVPALALTGIILVIVLVKRGQDRKDSSGQ